VCSEFGYGSALTLSKHIDMLIVYLHSVKRSKIKKVAFY
jgi:hypothetical protein